LGKFDFYPYPDYGNYELISALLFSESSAKLEPDKIAIRGIPIRKVVLINVNEILNLIIMINIISTCKKEKRIR
jgi:hypothetical protein